MSSENGQQKTKTHNLYGRRRTEMNEVNCSESDAAKRSVFYRVVMWLKGKEDGHAWVQYKKQTRGLIYYCRSCECGADQVKSNGALGDGKWRDISSPWRWDWELKDFNNAKIIDT